MPIKLPKSFARRRSSGNVLEDSENPPQRSSFRVIERASSDARSASEGNLLSPKNVHAERRSSQPLQDLPDSFYAQSPKPLAHNRYSLFSGPLVSIRKRLTNGSDSGGTVNSNVTAATYESSSSLRVSSSSTSRSNELTTPDNSQPPRFYDKPQLTGALRAAGRTFSLGGRFSKQSPLTPQPLTTDSTAATATPPKLLDSDLDLGEENDFQIMLDDLGDTSRSKAQEPSFDDRSVEPKGLQISPSATHTVERQPRPAPINTDRSKEVEPSPYSWDSGHSQEGLLGTPDPSHGDSLPAQANSMSLSERRKSATPTTTPPATTSHRALERPKFGAEKGLRRSVAFSERLESTAVKDEDARLIMESLYSSKGDSQQSSAAEHDHDHDHEAEEDVPLFNNGSPRETGSSPRQPTSPTSAEFEPDPSIADHARIAAEYEHNALKSPTPPPTNKVMTPLQFERYREQQELRRSDSIVSKSEYSVDSDYEDQEDETEKDREAERQRRKQEANLAVYRQQMMKVTGQQMGQQASTPSLRPEMDSTSSSTPNQTIRTPNAGTQPGSMKSTSDGDEDEEIPLGILAAHGFPSKSRPPTRLSSRSISNLRPGSSAGSAYGDPHHHEAMGQANLPAFAKNLPRDPYYGASLVNPSNRESMALGGGATVHNNPPSSALPPGGLVGVIATEERARAIRRGSPNTQAMYEHGGGMIMPGAPLPHPSSGIPRPYSMAISSPGTPSPQSQITATEQAQINLSQQMSQMMQMQMQWMQQMMQMQGGQVPPQPPPQMPMGGPIPMAANPNTRPISTVSTGPFNQGIARPAGDQRTFSMAQDPNMPARLNGPPMPYAASGAIRPGTPAGPGSAPSIAPSERSNAGAAPRYQPMTAILPEHILIPKPWNNENSRSSITSAKASVPSATVRPVSSGSLTAATKPRTIPVPVDDDDDDDEGWAEMMKKRENKKSNWKTKQETNSSSDIGDLVSIVH